MMPMHTFVPKVLMRILLLFMTAVALISCGSNARPASQEQSSVDPMVDFRSATLDFQKRINDEFSNSETSPLPDSALSEFHGLPFFDPDSSYRVVAEFIRTPGLSQFQMKTSTDRRPEYRKYGEAHFQLKNVDCVLNLYQSLELMSDPEYEHYLFLPFTDLSNGVETYVGGRYLDIRIPEGDSVTLDFNTAYNPYCAYSHDYSCPVPPPENHLEVPVLAGVKKPE